MSADKLLLVKGRAGMGNRILALLNGILYARLTGRRLVVDWSDQVYSPDGSNVFDRFFESPQVKPGERIPETNSINPSIWDGQLAESALELERRHPQLSREDFRRLSSIDLSRLDHPEDVAVFWAFSAEVHLLRPHFLGEFAHLRRMPKRAILSTLLERDLLLQRDLQRHVDEFWLEHLDDNVIGVHVRYSDRRARLDAILRRLDALVRRHRDARIFLATDNVEIKKLIETRYSAVVSAPHWYPEPGSSVHHNPSAPDRVANGVGALIDLYLLGRSRYLIVDTRSSLSRVAVRLAAKTASRIVDVKPLSSLPPPARNFVKPVLNRLGFHELTSDGIVRRAVGSANPSERDRVRDS